LIRRMTDGRASANETSANATSASVPSVPSSGMVGNRVCAENRVCAANKGCAECERLTSTMGIMGMIGHGARSPTRADRLHTDASNGRRYCEACLRRQYGVRWRECLRAHLPAGTLSNGSNGSPMLQDHSLQSPGLVRQGVLQGVREGVRHGMRQERGDLGRGVALGTRGATPNQPLRTGGLFRSQEV
jgi:hypothetical protein